MFVKQVYLSIVVLHYIILHIADYFLSIRYVSLMQGHIWVESDGIGKGCTATFVVRLGLCENPDGSQQKILPLPWKKQRQKFSSSRGMPADPGRLIRLKTRYQKSV